MRPAAEEVERLPAVQLRLVNGRRGLQKHTGDCRLARITLDLSLRLGCQMPALRLPESAVRSLVQQPSRWVANGQPRRSEMGAERWPAVVSGGIVVSLDPTPAAGLRYVTTAVKASFAKAVAERHIGNRDIELRKIPACRYVGDSCSSRRWH